MTASSSSILTSTNRARLIFAEFFNFFPRPAQTSDSTVAASGSHPGIPVPEGADNLLLFGQEDKGQMRIKNAGGSEQSHKTLKRGIFMVRLDTFWTLAKERGYGYLRNPLKYLVELWGIEPQTS